MAYWLFKQEPSSYSYSQLEKDGKTTWDGVANNLALKHLRGVKKGDKVFFYHTGDEKSIVGIMQALSAPYADPKDQSLVVVDVQAISRLPKPVSLQAIKADVYFSSWELVRISRLSVMPVPEPLWKRVVKMAGL